MEQIKLYVSDSGEVVSPEQHHAVMMLIKVLFRLNVVSEEQALKIATKFRILFV